MKCQRTCGWIHWLFFRFNKVKFLLLQKRLESFGCLYWDEKRVLCPHSASILLRLVSVSFVLFVSRNLNTRGIGNVGTLVIKNFPVLFFSHAFHQHSQAFPYFCPQNTLMSRKPLANESATRVRYLSTQPPQVIRSPVSALILSHMLLFLQCKEKRSYGVRHFRTIHLMQLTERKQLKWPRSMSAWFKSWKDRISPVQTFCCCSQIWLFLWRMKNLKRSRWGV